MDRGDHRMSDGILGTSRGLEWHRAVAPVSEVGEITAHELALSRDIAGRRNALNLGNSDDRSEQALHPPDHGQFRARSGRPSGWPDDRRPGLRDRGTQT